MSDLPLAQDMDDYGSPESIRVVTVAEVREALAGLPGDAPLFVNGYEGGLDRPYLGAVRLRTLEPYADAGGSYTGPWSERRDGEFRGFVLHRQQ